MEFNETDFDLDRLKRFEEKITLQTTNFSTINRVCKQALRFSSMTAIIAETGYGKTNALEYFAQQNERVIYICMKKAMTSRVMYNEILKAAGWKNIYRESSLFNIIESIAYYLSESTGKKLLIIDEANHISNINLIHLHDLRDATQNISGIIIAGPKQFQQKMEYLESINKYGVPEFMRRIFNWIELGPPSFNEKCNLYREYGFKNDTIIKSYAEIDKTLDDVWKNVKRVALLYLNSIGEL